LQWLNWGYAYSEDYLIVLFQTLVTHVHASEDRFWLTLRFLLLFFSSLLSRCRRRIYVQFKIMPRCLQKHWMNDWWNNVLRHSRNISSARRYTIARLSQDCLPVHVCHDPASCQTAKRTAEIFYCLISLTVLQCESLRNLFLQDLCYLSQTADSGSERIRSHLDCDRREITRLLCRHSTGYQR